ncbi:MAG: hypothetical protein IPK82_08675 [Polyangiaceae bacterium]|nr:hypothetical protein [Polyangiaceae bacterium]
MGRRKEYALCLLAAASLFSMGCAGAGRFALQSPVLQDRDNTPFAKAPPEDAESDYANTLDVILLRPLSHAFLFESGGEAHNVNSLDEVPNSTWYQNRKPTPAELDRGPCPDAGPSPPFTVKNSKTGGTTPGFVVKDSRGQRYMVKLDGLGPRQPEISTAADAIGSRLYWAIGFNAPCNDVVYVQTSDFRVDKKSTETLSTGEKLPLTEARLTEVLAKGTKDKNGLSRVSASRFIDGEPVGTWRTEGTRKDDPNDLIPHENRRELRGERFLAAWINHWDSRGPNTFDSFVKAPKGGGYIVHYFLDFSDSFGATPIRTEWPEPRMGFTTVSNVPAIAADAVGLGFVRRPWDEVTIDPRYPNLGFLDVAHFDPKAFSPQTPLVRWARAEPADLAWMARKIAGIGEEHVKAAVRVGKLSNPAEEAQLVRILMGRREKILKTSFAEVSPLADLNVTDGAFCFVDLGVEVGLSNRSRNVFTLEWRRGVDLTLTHPTPVLENPRGAEFCVPLPVHLDLTLPDNAPDRYATLDVIRVDRYGKTLLRAHFYDLGSARGYRLVGVERL